MFELKNIFRFLKLSIGSFILSFLFFEIFVRIFLPQKIEPSLYTYKFGTFINQHKANIQEKLFYEGVPYHLKIDEHHLRNFKKIPYKKPKNTFRILSLGDSILKGPGLEVEETFAFYLDKTLNSQESKIKYDVVNAAMGGANFLDYILFLKNEGYKYSPDLILLTLSNYDFGPGNWDSFEFETISAKKIPPKEIQITLTNPKIIVPRHFFNKLMLSVGEISFYTELSKVSHFLNLIRLKANFLSLKKKKKPLDDLDQFLTNYNLLKEGEKVKDFRLKWVFEDHQFYENHLRSKPLTSALFSKAATILSETANQTGAKLAILDLPEDEEVFGEPSLTTTIKFPNKLSNNQLNLLDPIRRFLTKNQFPLNIPNDPHWSPAGHYLAALLTYNFLLENKLIPEEDLLQKTKIDLNDPKIIERIENSNKRVDPYVNNLKDQFYLKGFIAKNQGLTESAIQNFKRYLELKNDEQIEYLLATLYLKKGEPNNAYLHFKKMEQSNNPSHLEKLGLTFYALKNYKKAIQVLQRAQSMGNTSTEVINMIGLCFYYLKNFLESERYLLEAVRKDPFYSGNLASLYFDNGYFEKAINQYKQALIQNPNSFKMHYVAGLAYLKLDDLERAEKMFLNAQQIQPENKDAQSILDQLQARKKK